MSAGTYNFKIEQGSTFSRKIVWRDGNDDLVALAGFTAKLQVRHQKTRELLLELTSGVDGGLTLGDDNGEIDIYISHEDTAAITWTMGAYDLQLTSANNEVTRLLQGTVSISREVTL